MSFQSIINVEDALISNLQSANRTLLLSASGFGNETANGSYQPQGIHDGATYYQSIIGPLLVYYVQADDCWYLSATLGLSAGNALYDGPTGNDPSAGAWAADASDQPGGTMVFPPLLLSVKPYGGEREEILERILLEAAPVAFVHLARIINRAVVFESSRRTGRLEVEDISPDDLDIVESVIVCTKSLRGQYSDLQRGASNVVGAYEVLDTIIGSGDTQPLPNGCIRGRVLMDGLGPCQFVGLELLAQNYTHVVYDVQFKMRAAL